MPDEKKEQHSLVVARCTCWGLIICQAAALATQIEIYPFSPVGMYRAPCPEFVSYQFFYRIYEDGRIEVTRDQDFAPYPSYAPHHIMVRNLDDESLALEVFEYFKAKFEQNYVHGVDAQPPQALAFCRVGFQLKKTGNINSPDDLLIILAGPLEGIGDEYESQ